MTDCHNCERLREDKSKLSDRISVLEDMLKLAKKRATLAETSADVWRKIAMADVEIKFNEQTRLTGDDIILRNGRRGSVTV